MYGPLHSIWVKLPRWESSCFTFLSTPQRVPSPTLDPLLTPSEAPLSCLFLAHGLFLFFNYVDHLICTCDSCLLDDAELTWTEHRRSKINSGCVCLGFWRLVLQMPSWGRGQTPKSNGSVDCCLQLTAAHPSSLLFSADLVWARMSAYENLLSTHCSLCCQSYKWMFSALGCAVNQCNACFPIISLLLSLLFTFPKNYKRVWLLKFKEYLRAYDAFLPSLVPAPVFIFFSSVGYFLNFT